MSTKVKLVKYRYSPDISDVKASKSCEVFHCTTLLSLSAGLKFRISKLKIFGCAWIWIKCVHEYSEERKWTLLLIGNGPSCELSMKLVRKESNSFHSLGICCDMSMGYYVVIYGSYVDAIPPNRLGIYSSHYWHMWQSPI